MRTVHGFSPALSAQRRHGEQRLLRRIEQHLLKNWSLLWGYAMRLTGDRESASDLVQTCAVKALASASPPCDEIAARIYLFKVIRNAWIDDFRRAKVRCDDSAVKPLDGTVWNYDDRLIAEITVRQAVAQIEPVYREIIEIVDLAGFRYVEAAEILDIPLGTVMSRLSRARAALLDRITADNIRPIATDRRHAR